MTADNTDPIWFHPAKFWGATRAMSREELDQFMDRIMDLAERRDLESLRRFDFITIGRPKPKLKQN